MTAEVRLGDALDVLATLPSESVHCVVTSPPFYGLRSYKIEPVTWGDGWRGHLGMEPDVDLYIAHLVAVFAEVKRVLRSDGVCWVNIGDSYAGSGQGGGGIEPEDGYVHRRKEPPGLKPLDLCGVPERFALAMQKGGWYWRDRIAWCKTSPMPESVAGWRWERCRVRIKSAFLDWRDRAKETDRPVGASAILHQGAGNLGFTRQTEWAPCPGCEKCNPHGGYILRRGAFRTTRAWEYVLMFTKSPDYAAFQEQVREVGAEPERIRGDVIGTTQRRLAGRPVDRFAAQTVSRNPRSFQFFAPEPCNWDYCLACDFFAPKGFKGKRECPSCGRRQVNVPADAVDDGSEYIRLSDCPIHGHRPDAISQHDEPQAAVLPHMSDIHIDLAEEPPALPSSSRSPSSEYTSSGLIRGDSPAAKRYNKPFYKKDHAQLTNLPDIFSEGRDHHTGDKPVGFESDAQHPDTSENKLLADSVLHDRSVQISLHNEDKQIGAEQPARIAGHQNIGLNTSTSKKESGVDDPLVRNRAYRKDIPSCTCLPKKTVSPIVQHFALFPPSLPDWCIRASTGDKGCCPTCGAQWAPVVERESGRIRGGSFQEETRGHAPSACVRESGESRVLSYRATCSCPPHEPVPATVLDCFSGAATTLLAADRLGRSGIGIELSESYVKLARRRLQADAPLLAGAVPLRSVS